MREFLRLGAMLVIVLAGLAAAGHVDMKEAERMEVELLEHHVTVYDADTFPPVNRWVWLPIEQRECM